MTFSNPAPWTKLYRRSFVESNDLWFQNLFNANDVYFTKMAFAVAERIVCINEPLVTYRVGSGKSIQSRKFNKDYCYLDALKALYDGLADRHLLDRLERSFYAFLVISIAYELRPYENRSDRFEVYGKLFDEPLIQKALLYDRGYFLNPKDYDYLKSMQIASRVHAEKNPGQPTGIQLIHKSELYQEEPLFSILMPVFNCEESILKCLDSIFGQDFYSYELIVVDDGSTDQTVRTVMEYVQNKDNVSVYSQKHSAATVARNNCLDMARGEYVFFIDSCDYIADGVLKQLAENVENLDVLLFSGEQLEDINCDKVYSGVELLDYLSRNGKYDLGLCVQVIRRRFLIDNCLRYPYRLEKEGGSFQFCVLLNAESAGRISGSLHYMETRKETLTEDKINYKIVHDYFEDYKEMRDYYYDNRENNSSWNSFHSSINKVIGDTLSLARSYYAQLPKAEKTFYYGYEDTQREYFERVIVDYAGRNNEILRKNEEIICKNSIIENNEKELTAIKAKADKLLKEKKTLKTKLKKTKNELKSVKREINSIRDSYSFKIGKAITWLPGKVKRIMRKLRDRTPKSGA